ncbi:sodium/proline symporter PutP [Microbacterium horticulturae]|uniref:Sodium/proline symporter n=1 Tax=Microbacterium horticulturae TaxID=3028316 RepID=A0ABY8C1Y4_9MICO|nr:sodium/proline symporter PutP [Microbacterium sp. KACC 23027]WEG10469.1 sodium/proline symporter PutP [Microbacterium sp. KACC 23027]
MSPQTYFIFALIAYFAAMIAIGVFATLRTKNHEDYMLGGRSLPPAVAALSAGASDMSGWLVMGLPGALYATGLIEAWLAIGLTIGAYLNWLFVAPRLRAYTEVSKNSITVPSFLENRTRDNSHVLRIVAGLVILVFFTLYVSSGMVAGGKFFQSSFGGDYTVGMLLVAGVTLAYTLFGGFLGATYTDFVQGLMIFAALLIVPVLAIVSIGDLSEIAEGITTVAPENLNWFGSGMSGATIIAILSSLAWGLGYFGQPHIIVRFMALRRAGDAKVARRIGMGWMILSLMGAVLTGLIGIAWFDINGLELPDPETVMLVMAQNLMHPFVAGLVLAAVLAAIMSTISSQLIVSSSALVEDIARLVFKKTVSEKALVWLGRSGVLVVAVIAILIALDSNASVLELVGFAWAGFGSAFGPLILLSLFWRKLTNVGAIVGMVAGAATAWVWGQYLSGGIFDLYEIIPGFLINPLLAYVVSRATHKAGSADDREVQKEFSETQSIIIDEVKQGARV